MPQIIVSTDNEDIVITGDIFAIVNNRRGNRFLKDTLSCSFEDGLIRISNVDDYPHCFDKLKHITNMCNCDISFSDDANGLVNSYLSEEEKFATFSQEALLIRNNEGNLEELKAFKNALLDEMPARTLYDLQLLSAYHLAFSQNACNFSVPGAGKTSVVYGAYAYLHHLPPTDNKHIEKLLIIGPLSSFAPWELEFEECFGRTPRSKRLSADLSIESKKQFLYEQNNVELIMMSYASVNSLVNELSFFLKTNQVMIVLDEAHKIKNTSGGVYAESVLSIAQFATSRVILTGTPAPNGYEDLTNLFKFIWPTKKIIKFQTGQLRDMSKHDGDPRVNTLLNQIAPYYIRVKKSDLNIPDAIVHPPIIVQMKPLQRQIYDYIEQLYISDITENRDQSFQAALVQARMIRLMQASTNPTLLLRPLYEFSEIAGVNLSNVSEDDNITKLILDYPSSETPAKFEKTLELVEHILKNNGKVVIWACFIKTMEYLSDFLTNAGITNEILYGATPIASDGIDKEDDQYQFTREAIIKRFNDKNSNLCVLIANPFAVSESISLHKACHNAIYLERSFNAAHFMQSKDRIHRYGLPVGTETNYYYLVSNDSIDETINERLSIKEQRMLNIIESMPIPLFKNVTEEGSEDIKAVLRDYARRIKTV